MCESDKSSELKLLSPCYDDDNHDYYASLLEKEIELKRAKNIALSGGYGSGKSSILKRVYKPKSMVMISLAPLATAKDVSTGIHNSENRESTSPNNANDKSPESETGINAENTEHPLDNNTTNQLEKEIVKQLLYSTNPSTLPLSHFHRIRSMAWPKRLLFSILTSLSCILLFMAFGWYYLIYDRIPYCFAKNILFPAGIFLLFAGIAWLFIGRFYGKLDLSKITAGGATVDLDDKPDTYFDKYLEEILYFFQQTKKTVVILEDLDRFEDPKIFDALHELNSILNSSLKAKKLRRRQKHDAQGRDNYSENDKAKVQFIYAIKDSIFSDQLGDTKNRLPFARTKFFDVIIPVVPFISHENAARLAFDEFESKNEIDENVLDIAAEFIPDMRILKNIRNEYVVYRHELDGNKMQQSGMDNSKLLGFLIYKNTYLNDADKLATGDSKLDAIYRASRTIIHENIKLKNDDLEKQKLELQKRRDASQKEYTEKLEEKLETELRNMAGCENDDSFQVKAYKLDKNNNSQESLDIHNDDFWNWLATIKPSDKTNFSVYGNVKHEGSLAKNLHPTKRQLSVLLETPLDFSVQHDSDILGQENIISGTEKTIENLKKADIRFLMNNSKYSANLNEHGTIFDEAQEQKGQDTTSNPLYFKDCSLSEFVKRLFHGQKLMAALLSNGWIGEDYIEYSTILDDGMSTQARKFLYQAIIPNNPSPELKLSNDDISIIIKKMRARGDTVFEEDGMLNYTLLDQLAKDSSKTSLFQYQIKRLSVKDDISDHFLKEYLVDGTKQETVLSHLTPYRDDLIPLLLSVPYPPDRENDLKRFADSILSNLSSGIDYEIGDKNQTKSLIESVMQDENTNTFTKDPSDPKPLALVCLNAGIRANLTKLPDGLYSEFLQDKLYEYNRENIFGQNTAASLNAMGMAAQNKANANQNNDLQRYSATLLHLQSYLDFLKPDEYAINVYDDQGIYIVLRDIAKVQEQYISETGDSLSDTLTSVFRHCPPTMKIKNITINPTEDINSPKKTDHATVSNEWKPYLPALFSLDRIEPSFNNLYPYSFKARSNSLFANDDDNDVRMITIYLKKQSRILISNDNPGERQELAQFIFNTRMPFEHRKKLINSLGVEELNPQQIDPVKIPKHIGYAGLLEEGLISDSAESWNQLTKAKWSEKAKYINQSRVFSSYMDGNLQPDDACKMLITRTGDDETLHQLWDVNPSIYIFGAKEKLLVQTWRTALRDGRKPINPKYIYENQNAFIDRHSFAKIYSLSISDLSPEQVIKTLTESGDNSEQRIFTDRAKVYWRSDDTPLNRKILEYLKDHDLMEILPYSADKNVIFGSSRKINSWNKILNASLK
ncbi:hypothetical protein GA0061078_1628 [Bifidobacterium bohemicum]|uniref:NTPase protein n=1 Tax=Bifidobacterium bohemicum DSM 22767 TaxID=1437606 RepID=A0A086ZHC3_9BIFI|nr:hypothetical protein [Bifidobacterium bohemicum]KFI45923.1 NTPase protein [Bifidobacterium bohemicum DSM 22767]SCC14966.1 hypothetical protein GA0061078_1628 [Bifidobacterium bohemicum]